MKRGITRGESQEQKQGGPPRGGKILVSALPLASYLYTSMGNGSEM